jgi:hypothetical protein
MKRFIFTIILFTSPIMILALLTQLFYSKSGGDLNRLGKISVNSNYRKIFKSELTRQINYTQFSEINFSKKRNWNVLTIGDSFSQQDGYGYQSYLASIYNVNLINFDFRSYFAGYNPIEFLYQISNGNILDTLQTDYIILQMVERYFITHCENIKHDAVITIDDLDQRKSDRSKAINENTPVFSGDFFRFPLYSILYEFDDNAYFSQVCKLELSKKCFSTEKNNLLILKETIGDPNGKKNNEIAMVNNELNLLSSILEKRNIKLIVLPSPNKYSVYHDYIIDNEYPKPTFFENLRKEKKEYIFIDSERILKDMVSNNIDDVYFYDDTHWSPIASKKLANAIYEIINPSCVPSLKNR